MPVEAVASLPVRSASGESDAASECLGGRKTPECTALGEPRRSFLGLSGKAFHNFVGVGLGSRAETAAGVSTMTKATQASVSRKDGPDLLPQPSRAERGHVIPRYCISYPQTSAVLMLLPLPAFIGQPSIKLENPSY
jgi:hypothetical protein